MDAKYQDIHILYEKEWCCNKDKIVECNIRQVTIKHIQATDLFIKINVVDEKGKEQLIIVPKLSSVKILID